MDLYSGEYFNAVYEKATLSVFDGRLSLVMGPKKVKMTLTHWERDCFTLHWPVFGFDQEFGFVNFEVNAQGRVKGMVLDRLNQEADLGVFKKAEVKVKIEDSKK
jgi:hypothetical protein